MWRGADMFTSYLIPYKRGEKAVPGVSPSAPEKTGRTTQNRDFMVGDCSLMSFTTWPLSCRGAHLFSFPPRAFPTLFWFCLDALFSADLSFTQEYFYSMCPALYNVKGEHVQVRVRINDEWIGARSATSVWWFKDSRWGGGVSVRTWCECQCEEINVTCTSLVWLTHEGNNGRCMWFWRRVYGDESSPCKRQNVFIFNTKVYIIN